MTITDTIRSRWNDLSARAQAHIHATRADLLNQWELWEEGYYYDTITADSAEEALEEAKANVDRANYPDAEGTIYISVSVRNLYTGDTYDATVTLEADEPECIDGRDHDWQSPIALVGGIKENPGVWGHGAGLIIHEACLRCGCRRTTDTWAHDPTTGEQGLTSVEYTEGAYDLDDMGYVVEVREVVLDRGLNPRQIDAAMAVIEDREMCDNEIAMHFEAIYGREPTEEDADVWSLVCAGTETWRGDRHVVSDRSDDTYTIAEGEDAAREIAYRCRAGHAADYVWQDEEGR